MQNKNAYVSQKEVPFPAGGVIVSKTDTKGIITYANDAFVAISGYSREELIGKSHNIVRHPDMPPSAFKWLWDTLKAERPWRGVVKNRCKNGDHYWVRATVAPIVEGGQITGYVSVRKAPTREQIAGAEGLYKELNRSGAQIASKYERYKFKNWSLKTKLQAVIIIPLVLFSITGQIVVWSELQRDIHSRASERGSQVASQIIDSANMLMLTGQISDVNNRKMLLQKIESSGNIKSARMVRSQQLIDQYGAGLPEEALKDDLQRQAMESRMPRVELAKDKLGEPVLRVITPYLASKNFRGTDCTGCHAAQEGTVLGAADVAIDLRQDLLVAEKRSWMMFGGQVSLLTFLFFFIGYCVERYVRRPVRAVGKEFRNIMEGNLDTEMDISVGDEMGLLLCEIQTMQCYLRTMVDEIVTPVGQMQRRIVDMDARVSSVADNAIDEQGHIQQIASTVEEFSQSIAEVANMAADSLNDARAMEAIILANANRMHGEINPQMSKAVNALQVSSSTIADLNAAIQKIGTIASAIKDIAEQTNLLALNAAIEAARAGEQGRGFAVVADEVRKLAERTATSTKDIAGTISEIDAISSAAVISTQGAIGDVEAGVALVHLNSEGLKKIKAAMTNVDERMEHIATASKEQSAASESVANSLERVTELVDHNAQSARDAKLAAEVLAKSAEELRKAGYPLTKCAMR
ncbi:MAG: chemotaxis protein [Gallionellales bacterium RIFCSPLOWO2_12_FULL_59_22]|nr:MAG: chemotaxis protein [Gallionellales bacterium RIFCSPLOWO2_02_FULL_59_110]OGT04059.1 MAG: chemotaxis protein [Gallionellales bacterium RIFCSPLOWO2_02_58_13]OGT11263.1 MAG: chemotaxis protein [Gallionellales bacterium RIFCSPLOWO2_12_FULL_59_22]